MTRPRFVVPASALDGTRCELRGPEFRHLRVRHLRGGSTVVLTDGHGRERAGTILSVARDHAVIALQALTAAAPEAGVRIVLAQGLLKAERFDLVVEKATELGVDEIVPFMSDRTVAKAGPTRMPRWSRIALAASKQSQRPTVPRVSPPTTLSEVLRRDTEALRLFLWEDAPTGGLHSAELSERRPTSILLVVGSEGGFAPAEAAAAGRHAFHLIRLGQRPLRAETASLVALAVCQFLWGSFRTAAS